MKQYKLLFLSGLLCLQALVAAAELEDINPSSFDHFWQADVSAERQNELNQQVLHSANNLAVGHPRLYGTDQQWLQSVSAFDQLDTDCVFEGQNDWGTVKNTRQLWQRYAWGRDLCRFDGVPFEQNNLTKYWYDSYSSYSLAKDQRNARLNALHLIRRLNIWYQANSTHWIGTKAEFEDFKQRFALQVVNELRQAPKNNYGYISQWHKGYNGSFFDLGSLPAFHFWNLFLDIYWDDRDSLAQTDFDFISAELEKEIDSYLESAMQDNEGLRHWSLQNANNWTVILNTAALYWVINFYDDPALGDKAKQVLQSILETNWLHRAFYLDDGAYQEGVNYMEVSMRPTLMLNRLFLTSFNEPLHAFRWGISDNLAQWYLNNMAPDGLSLDFSDAWARRGYSNYFPLLMDRWQELIGLAPLYSTEPDSCLASSYFARSYYDDVFSKDLWTVEPLLARDWATIVSSCSEVSTADTWVKLFPDYQQAVVSQKLVGKNTRYDPQTDKVALAQSEQTSVSLNATPAEFPHREIDVGALIWSAFGDRLLWDFGYGEIAPNSQPYALYQIKGGKGHFVKQTDQDALEFYVNPLDSTVDWNGMTVGIRVRYQTPFVAIASYLSEAVDAAGWRKVSIPLTAFNISASNWQSGDGDEPWEGAGIVNIQFKATGVFAPHSEFGIDEIRLLRPDDSGLDWYTDDYLHAVEPNAVFMMNQAKLSIKEHMTTGGANQSEHWLKLQQNNAGAALGFYFNGDTMERAVQNYIDGLPMGSNTLVIPNQYVNGDAVLNKNTNVSQVKRKHTSDVVWNKLTQYELDNYPVVELDASKVYGKDLTEGALDFFKRWLVPLNKGHYLVIDSFAAKDTIEESIQEYWYTKEDRVHDSCAKADFDETVYVNKVSAHRIDLTPKCHLLAWAGESAVRGSIHAASMYAGKFELGAPSSLKEDPYFARFVDGNSIALRNRLGDIEYRSLFRYVPDQKLSEDVRVFLLAAEINEFPAITLNKLRDSSDKVQFEFDTGQGLQVITLERQQGYFELTGLN